MIERDSIRRNEIKMRKEIKIVIFLLLIILAIGVGYFIGYKNAYDRIENATPNITPETFYAEIKEMKENWFQVEGLSINDINYRGKFEFSVDGETELEWRGTAIEVSDFDIGDTISITYFGNYLESSPAQITGIIRIQLLDDEI